jgi:hypothetical protein
MTLYVVVNSKVLGLAYNVDVPCFVYLICVALLVK